MCSGGNYASGAISAMNDTMNTISEMQAAKVNRNMIDRASTDRQHEISEAGSLQMNETAMTARAARAHSIAAASGSGVNLGSNSFLASLQTTTMASANKTQIELENEQNAQEDNFVKTQSELNAKASSPSFMGWFVSNNMAYLSGAYGGQVTGAKSTPMSEVDTGAGGGSSSSNNGFATSTADDDVFTGSGMGNSDMSMGSSFGSSPQGDDALMF